VIVIFDIAAPRFPGALLAVIGMTGRVQCSTGRIEA
jgi:hypothetical protein